MIFKISLSILFVFLSYIQTKAQLISSYGVKFGIVEASQSWNYSGTLSNSKIFDESRTGIDVGVYVEWFNFPIISVLTEMHYIQKGCKDEFKISTTLHPEGTGEKKSLAPQIDYLSIPILLKISLDSKLVTFYGIGGPRLDYLIGKNTDASGPVFDELKSTDFGFTVGLGFEIPVGLDYRVGGEFRYSPSSQYVFSNKYLKVKNESLEFLLTFGF